MSRSTTNGAQGEVIFVRAVASLHCGGNVRRNSIGSSDKSTVELVDILKGDAAGSLAEQRCYGRFRVSEFVSH
jgi:hypothetical protein